MHHMYHGGRRRRNYRKIDLKSQVLKVQPCKLVWMVLVTCPTTSPHSFFYIRANKPPILQNILYSSQLSSQFIWPKYFPMLFLHWMLYVNLNNYLSQYHPKKLLKNELLPFMFYHYILDLSPQYSDCSKFQYNVQSGPVKFTHFLSQINFDSIKLRENWDMSRDREDIHWYIHQFSCL